MARRYVYGPVPSRRLGLSLGVDTVAAKSCPFDCVYCQLGPTAAPTVERRRFFPLQDVLGDIRDKLAAGPRPDHITLGGSGEPTLNVELGELIAGIKAMTDVPVALLSGGALLHLPEVREAVRGADVILPSLDAGDAELFALVNRPAPGLELERIIEGMVELRREYTGRLWLEVMIVAGITDVPERLARLAGAVARVRPDRVQLNTPVRPSRDPRSRAASPARLHELCSLFTPAAEVIADFHAHAHDPRRHEPAAAVGDDVVTVLGRRPCTVDDLAVALSLDPAEVRAVTDDLLARGVIEWADGARHYLRPRS